MLNNAQIKKIFSHMRVIRPPKHRLSTFGVSDIEYVLVTNVTGFSDRSRLRTGHVKAEKPAILTNETLKNRFEGFGEEANAYADWLLSHYGKAIQGLEYKFRNEHGSSRIELVPPAQLINKIVDVFDKGDKTRQALLQGTDQHWELSIMKLIVEETLSSFSSNMQELQDRGFFDGEDRIMKQQHNEIRRLIHKARHDKNTVPLLGKRLKEYNLFEQYQDEFFQLIQ